MDEKGTAAHNPPDRFQLAGLDDRQRGFSRPVEFERVEGQYRARLRYESQQIVTAPSASEETALLGLIHALHGQGYRQLKTQLSFRKGIYLGSQQNWIEYADPMPIQSSGPLTKILNWLRSRE